MLSLRLEYNVNAPIQQDSMESSSNAGNNNVSNGGGVGGSKTKTNGGRKARIRGEMVGKTIIGMICGTLVYYHCAYRNSTFLSLLSDVFIVLLCSLAILGLLFRQINISVPVDPLEWQISQDTANSIFACLANTIGAAESVLRIAATGQDKRLFFKVVASLYMLSALGRVVSGVTIAYAGLCLFSVYLLAENSLLITTYVSRVSGRGDS
ncbi:Reticulon domain-containing protein [Heracleum sosnowskyi]|uniref:Reticulon domain-containing protein n=1 Tax=Heracleum sosnowskyi TaxID=360622 RepID=A0AAD8JI56_9APIA|nr:Reticulon domain-containing protein [Heracleum sosnowskyi]